MTPSTSPGDDNQVLAEQLRAALHRLIRQLRRGNEDDAISPLHKLLLLTILEHPGIGVGELAQQERLRSPTISGHIKTLEADGLVRRTEPASGDRRRVGLMVTARGRHVVESMRRQRTDRLAQAIGQLPPASRDAIRAAIDALNQLDA
ncbi:MarR family transcriptional regulator [Dyella solisilvae]|uniref:MarR family transcriptional regulator n=1 Tax=Dyella solisilvae TaxID=1920168 RepID=A0A370K6I5_9GAMM|nr:MarR family transcriptional regulator [Dyella solisilvae]RDI98265.1 MarR family transcriptional regulator [Dyella solisilvae]